MNTTVSFPALLQGFFTRRLMQQRRASPHTIGSYRDTFRLLLRFVQAKLGQPPSQLAFEQIDAPLIAEFLEDLEKNRGSTARSRNLRLTAIRSFFRFPAVSPDCVQRRPNSSPAGVALEPLAFEPRGRTCQCAPVRRRP